MHRHPPIPLIDIFAGPGGLGEGFASLRVDRQRAFSPALSIEKDAAAHRTLKLRAFFRHFPDGQAPPDYYRYLRGELSLDGLYASHPTEHAAAEREAWCAELGVSKHTEVRRRITQAFDMTGRPDAPWVLLGGPPCQPFSLAGRSRNAPGTDTQYSDGKDTRHNLYREYLQIIADFWPAVFVMENVRGLLSAKFDGKPIFPQIKRDLQDPAAVVGKKRRRVTPHQYTLYPINPGTGLFPDETRPEDFLVRCENYGIPQARHRLILLGVRDDIDASPVSLELQTPVPARRVLDGLPRLRGGLSKNDSPDARRETLLNALDSAWLEQVNQSDPAVRAAVEDALANLAEPAADLGGEYLAKACPPAHEPDWYRDEKLAGVCNHRARGHMPSDLHRYLFAAAFAQTHARSPKLDDFPPALLPDHKNAKNPNAHTKFTDRFRVQLPGKPSTTVVSHIAKDGHYYIHPDPTQCRSLTVREAARLQTFPDNYRFVPGSRQPHRRVCITLQAA